LKLNELKGKYAFSSKNLIVKLEIYDIIQTVEDNEIKG